MAHRSVKTSLPSFFNNRGKRQKKAITDHSHKIFFFIFVKLHRWRSSSSSIKCWIILSYWSDLLSKAQWFYVIPSPTWDIWHYSVPWASSSLFLLLCLPRSRTAAFSFLPPIHIQWYFHLRLSTSCTCRSAIPPTPGTLIAQCSPLLNTNEKNPQTCKL